MKVKKADDYQSWFIEECNEALLIDPWFDFALVDGKGWFLQRKKEKKSHLTEDEISQVKNIIITAPFEDHLHFICRSLGIHNYFRKCIRMLFFHDKIPLSF